MRLFSLDWWIWLYLRIYYAKMPHKVTKLVLTFKTKSGSPLPVIRKGKVMIETITAIQQITATLTPEDAGGHPGPIMGIPTWASSDTSIFTVQPAGDGMTAVLTAAGTLGTANLTVTATPAKPDGSADAPVSVTVQVAVTAAEVSQLLITFGTPTTQNPTAPPPPPAP